MSGVVLVGLVAGGIFICDGFENWLAILWFSIRHFTLEPWAGLALWGLFAANSAWLVSGIRRLRRLREFENER